MVDVAEHLARTEVKLAELEGQLPGVETPRFEGDIAGVVANANQTAATLSVSDTRGQGEVAAAEYVGGARPRGIIDLPAIDVHEVVPRVVHSLFIAPLIGNWIGSALTGWVWQGVMRGNIIAKPLWTLLGLNRTRDIILAASGFGKPPWANTIAGARGSLLSRVDYSVIDTLDPVWFVYPSYVFLQTLVNLRFLLLRPSGGGTLSVQQSTS